jgi:hypothetical protein
MTEYAVKYKVIKILAVEDKRSSGYDRKVALMRVAKSAIISASVGGSKQEEGDL